MTEPTTEQQFFAEYDQMKDRLKAAEQQIMVLTDQLRTANTEGEALAYKNDFLTQEIARITTSREQYERIAIRSAAVLDGALTALVATIQQMQAEIRDAAFIKVPGSAKQSIADEEHEGIKVQDIAAAFAPEVDARPTSATLPPNRPGNGLHS